MVCFFSLLRLVWLPLVSVHVTTAVVCPIMITRVMIVPVFGADLTALVSLKLQLRNQNWIFGEMKIQRGLETSFAFCFSESWVIGIFLGNKFRFRNLFFLSTKIQFQYCKRTIEELVINQWSYLFYQKVKKYLWSHFAAPLRFSWNLKMVPKVLFNFLKK